MKKSQTKIIAFLLSVFLSSLLLAQKKPNIIIVFTDDISAREFPIYGSDTWTAPTSFNTSNPNYRANTPVLDMMATQGCYIETAWAATVCSPSRAMMMTGRYAHLHKWYGNGTIGTYIDPADGRRKSIPLYASSPITLGHVATMGGYETLWAGKTQMRGADISRFGFNEGIFTAGGEGIPRSNPNPNTKFRLRNVGGQLINEDSGNPVGTNDESGYVQSSWYWRTSASTMIKNDSGEFEYNWWPIEPEDVANYSDNTYGPDVELDYIFDFMDRKVADDEPFFIYHTSHLGHDAFDFLSDGATSRWPGTPKVSWDGSKYTRTEPNITRTEAADGTNTYNTNNSITESGIHHHINYLDYQMSLYLDKLKELGIEDNTLIIFSSDNGTSGFGKRNVTSQRGTHVPFIVYGPGLGITKTGKQDVLFNIADVLPTIAEISDVELPCDYEINGESFWEFLTTDKEKHRDWIYGYDADRQLIRDQNVVIDGRDVVYDAQSNPTDLTSFTQLASNLTTVLSNSDLEAAKNNLINILPSYSLVNFGQNELPDSSANGTCNIDPITVTFNETTANIDSSGTTSNPISFTVSNIPNNNPVELRARIYPVGEDVTGGEFVAQFTGATLDLNSNTPNFNITAGSSITESNTPTNGLITRTFSINNFALQNGKTINEDEAYVVAIRFVDAGTTGVNEIEFSTEGEQPVIGSGNTKNATFSLNTLNLNLVTVTFDEITTNIDSNGTVSNPISFTVSNVPNNNSVQLRARIYPINEDVTGGAFVAQFTEANLDLNSATTDFNITTGSSATNFDTPVNGLITRTYTINNFALQGSNTINEDEAYVVAIRFVDAGTTGVNEIEFSTEGEQPVIGSGNEKNATFILNTLNINSIKVNSNLTPTSIDFNGNTTNPISFTVSNIPNNTAVGLRARVYPSGEDITQGAFVAQFTGAPLDINSNTTDFNVTAGNSVTTLNTPINGLISRTYTINNFTLRNGSSINDNETYVVAIRFVDAGSTGINQLEFATSSSIQPVVGGAGNAKNATFELNTLVVDNAVLSNTNFKFNTNNTNSIYLYPNPVNSTLNIGGIIELNEYKIVNLSGKTVKRGNSQLKQIVVSDLTTGIYFLITPNGVAKFIKN